MKLKLVRKEVQAYLLKLDEDLWMKIVKLAKKNNVTRREVILQAIRLEIDSYSKAGLKLSKPNKAVG